MACCGRNKNPKKKPTGVVKWNGKVCPKCGWVMTRVHKYDQTTRTMTKQWICPNKSVKIGQPCNYRETI